MSSLGEAATPALNGALGDHRLSSSTWPVQDLALDDLPRMPETARQEGRKDPPGYATAGAHEDQNRHNRNGLAIDDESEGDALECRGQCSRSQPHRQALGQHL